MARYKEDVYIGSQFLNSLGESATIVKIESARKVLIEWEGGNTSLTTVTQLRNQHFKNPMRPSVWGTGFIGTGEFNPTKNNEAYLAWQGIMQRCYDPKLHAKYPSYSNKSVSPSWHCFQHFVPWWEQETLNKPSSEGWAVDKDILRSNEYGPESALVVPKVVNLLFLTAKEKRGVLPIGVNIRPETGKYRARCQNGTGKPVALGEYTTIDEAFLAYKRFKEARIKEVANEYKDVISKRAFDALINYEVRIDD